MMQFHVETEPQWREVIPTLEIPWGSVVLLEGAMGVGKTTFVTHSTSALLGPEIEAGSPTFTLENVYQSNGSTLYHLDLYRLKTWEEWIALSILDREDLEKSIYCIEWSDKFSKEQWQNFFLGTQVQLYNFKLTSENQVRQVKIAKI